MRMFGKLSANVVIHANHHLISSFKSGEHYQFWDCSQIKILVSINKYSFGGCS